MTPEPDYSTYTLDQLRETRRWIDVQQYPDRAARLTEEIERRTSLGPQPRVQTPPNKYDTLPLRILALLIDDLVLLPIPLIGFAIYAFYPSGIVPASWLVLETLSLYIYSIYCHGKFGMTVGKRLSSLRVVDLSGEPLLFTQAFLRDSVGVFLSVVACAFVVPMVAQGPSAVESMRADPPGGLLTLAWVNWLWSMLEIATALFNEKKRALHDYIAHSVVVRTDLASSTET